MLFLVVIFICTIAYAIVCLDDYLNDRTRQTE